MKNRNDRRDNLQLREITIKPQPIRYAEGGVEVSFGHTKILCTASIENSLPKWLSSENHNRGWVTAEYGMLPRSTHTRMKRESISSSGRTKEISRLIGRSLRSVTDLRALGERQVIVDCDVIQADGGTRTAAITGGFVALALALQSLVDSQTLSSLPLKNYLAALSAGLSNGEVLLDLNYEEDSSIETDMNIVMTGSKHLVEIQGTAEGAPFSYENLISMTKAVTDAIDTLFKAQEAIIGHFFPRK